MPINRMISNDGGYRELQTKLARVGKIRCGAYVQEPGRRGRPAKLDTWRFTSTDEAVIRLLAQGYGGEAVEYKPQGGGPSEWEVVTDTDVVPVYIINGQKIDPNYEAWGRGRTCVRRCDGVTNRIDETPCVCTSDNPPRDLCKITLRVNLLLRDVPGFGSWLFETHGENAVAEISSLAQLVKVAPMPVPAMFRLRTETRRPWDPEKRAFVTREFQVPWFDVSALSAAQIGAGGDVLSRALQAAGAPVLDAGPARALPAEPSAASPDSPDNAAPTASKALTSSTTMPSASPSSVPTNSRHSSNETSSAPAALAGASTTETSTAGAGEGRPVVTLSEDDRATILAKIEQKTTVAELKAVAAKLVERGVKDEKIKQALKSKAAAIETALQIGGSAPGPADAPRAQPDPKPSLAEARAHWERHEGEQYAEALARGADPQDVYDAGGPLHWLASDDQARTFSVASEPPEPQDHAAVADAFPLPGEAEPQQPQPVETPSYDKDAEFMALFSLSGPLGWTTADVHDRIKAFCGVERSQQATGAQLHALAEAIRHGEIR